MKTKMWKHDPSNKLVAEFEGCRVYKHNVLLRDDINLPKYGKTKGTHVGRYEYSYDIYKGRQGEHYVHFYGVNKDWTVAFDGTKHQLTAKLPLIISLYERIFCPDDDDIVMLAVREQIGDKLLIVYDGNGLLGLTDIKLRIITEEYECIFDELDNIQYLIGILIHLYNCDDSALLREWSDGEPYKDVTFYEED